MVLHRLTPSTAPHPLRVWGLAVAYAFALVTGTAVLIAAFGAQDASRPTSPNGLTAADVVMQQAAERGVQAPEALLLASRNLPNDKRGY
jgi:hypothetical protein